MCVVDLGLLMLGTISASGEHLCCLWDGIDENKGVDCIMPPATINFAPL